MFNIVFSEKKSRLEKDCLIICSNYIIIYKKNIEIIYYKVNIGCFGVIGL